jgi:hypothetical protein
MRIACLNHFGRITALHQRYAIHYPACRMWNCQRGARSLVYRVICLGRCAPRALRCRLDTVVRSTLVRERQTVAAPASGWLRQ